ncbi:cycloartenol synthase [Artemisia annua]|uniref:Cycloartenol synthase n=1 Tax=Artemisia annua TaxID=35608 RepID=A0A2U1PFQ0_ARTAN|nr:cycloartenol synthase [Artemisia annua]
MVYLPMSYLYGNRFVGPITPTVLALRDELFTVPYHNIDWNEARNMLVADEICKTDFVVPSEIHKRLCLARKSNLGTHTNISAKKAQEIQMPKHGKKIDKILASEKVEKVKMMQWLNFLTIGEKEVKFSPGSCSRLRKNDSRKRSTRTDLSCRLLSANYLSNMEDFSYVRAYLYSSHTLSKRHKGSIYLAYILQGKWTENEDVTILGGNSQVLPNSLTAHGTNTRESLTTPGSKDTNPSPSSSQILVRKPLHNQNILVIVADGNKKSYTIGGLVLHNCPVKMDNDLETDVDKGRFIKLTVLAIGDSVVEINDNDCKVITEKTIFDHIRQKAKSLPN